MHEWGCIAAPATKKPSHTFIEIREFLVVEGGT